MIGLPDTTATAPLVLPSIAALIRDDRPTLPAAGDGTAWEDGLCWLSCGQWTGVASVGVITMSGVMAPMFACEACTRRLHAFVWGYLHRSGGGCDRVAQPPVAAAGETPALEGLPGVPHGRARRRRDGWRRLSPFRDGR